LPIDKPIIYHHHRASSNITINGALQTQQLSPYKTNTNNLPNLSMNRPNSQSHLGNPQCISFHSALNKQYPNTIISNYLKPTDEKLEKFNKGTLN
jgi:hypothetical protein